MDQQCWPGSLLEMQSLSPPLDLLNRNLHLITISKASVSRAGPTEERSHGTQVSPLLGPAPVSGDFFVDEVARFSKQKFKIKFEFEFHLNLDFR